MADHTTVVYDVADPYYRLNVAAGAPGIVRLTAQIGPDDNVETSVQVEVKIADLNAALRLAAPAQG